MIPAIFEGRRETGPGKPVKDPGPASSPQPLLILPNQAPTIHGPTEGDRCSEAWIALRATVKSSCLRCCSTHEGPLWAESRLTAVQHTKGLRTQERTFLAAEARPAPGQSRWAGSGRTAVHRGGRSKLVRAAVRTSCSEISAETAVKGGKQPYGSAACRLSSSAKSATRSPLSASGADSTRGGGTQPDGGAAERIQHFDQAAARSRPRHLSCLAPRAQCCGVATPPRPSCIVTFPACLLHRHFRFPFAHHLNCPPAVALHLSAM